MTQAIRSQGTCLLATGEYARSFWGRYIWIYQAQGGLVLSPDSLLFDAGEKSLEIPLKDITAIGTSRFTTAAKPFGLLRLDVRYLDGLEGDERLVHLVPCDSVNAPTWETSQIVQSWYESLARLDAMAGKKKLAVAPVPTDPGPGIATVGVWKGLVPLAILLVIVLCATLL